MQKFFLIHKTILFFCFSLLTTEAYGQLGFCQGNSGDPIFTETFGAGLGQVPLPPGTTSYTFANGQPPDDGFYAVTSTTNYFDWLNVDDVTPGDTNGRMLVVNSGASAGEFYRTDIDGLCENTTYEFSSWLINLTPANGFCGAGAIPINVGFEIWDNTDTVLLASGTTGNIPGTVTPNWEQYALVFQTTPGQTSVILKMLNNSSGGCGNDLAIDDIVFKSCGDLIAIEDGSGANSTSICNSETPYAETITAIPDFTVFSNHFYQWQESTDGINWTDIAGATDASLAFTGVTTTTYYRAKVAEIAANLDNVDCITFSDVYEITVNPSPTESISNGDVEFNCTTNEAIVSVAPESGISVNWFDTATGGILLQSDSETYTATVAGTYYAEAVDDVTGCVSETRVAVNVTALSTPDAPTSDGDVDFNCETNEASVSVTVPPGITVNWYDAATGGVLLESDSITYNATNEGTFYAEAVDGTTGCASVGRTAVSTAIVLPDAPMSDGDVSLDCDTNEAILTVSVPNGISVDWFDAASDGNVLESNSTVLVVNSQGAYYAEAIDEVTGCVSALRVAVNANVTVLDDPSFTVSPSCDGAVTTITGTPGGNFELNPIPNDGAIIDTLTGTVTNGTPGESYTIEYTTLGACSSTSSQTFSVLPAEDASFVLNPTCDGAVATVTGTIGGEFSFNPEPTDGAQIDSASGLITDGVSETSYSVQYTTNGLCPSTSTELVTVLPEVTLINPTALEVCDDATPDGLTQMDLSLKNAEITGGNPGYAVSYYETQADADGQSNPLPSLYTNTSNPQTIYVSVEDSNTGCSDTTTLELIVEQAPMAFTPQPLRYCDPDNDGFGVFTLTDAQSAITGGAPGLSVTYHETMVNAMNNADAIDTSVTYNNIVVNSQTLYVRVESATIATDCATLVELQLIVEPTPQLVAPTALEVCDDITADGFASFDLTSKAEELLNGQDPSQYAVSYYTTQANAEQANNPIANPLAYTNTTSFNQVIWIRVEDTATVEGCYKITSLELIVSPLPVLVTPTPLTLCDVNNPGDEQEAFTLEAAEDEILNGQTGITLSYYESQSDADTAENPITSPYTNISNAQTIFVRAQNDVTGCYNTVTLTLRVNPIPSPEPTPAAIEVCDDDNDGFGVFDLEQRTIEITNGELDVAITYHETQSEAETGTNAISGLYTNIVANNQMIYVRSENTLTGCYSLTQNTLELIVRPAPEVPSTIAPYVICDTNADGIAQFDLSIKDEEIYNGQDPAALALSYHVSAAEAQSGNNPIINTTNYTNTTNPQTIYVRLFNPSTGCQDTGEFELEVDLPPVAVQPTQLSVCDDLGEVPGDEITVFDLTVKDSEITAGNASWSVAYYETSAEAEAQENAIADPTQYTNTSVDGLSANPQTLYVVVTDTNTGCVDYTTLTIRVQPNPTPTPSDQLPDLELCDESNTGDGQEVFDLTANEILIRNGESGVTLSYHESAADANTGQNAIVDPTQYSNTQSTNQEIYVRVTNDVTGCYALVNFTLIVHPLPEVVAVTDFIQCELNTDGIDSFDLRTKDEDVLNGQDPSQFIVSYHASLADAEAGQNGLVSPYSNTVNPQQIFVRITNTETGCAISTQSFNIEVQEAAEANPDGSPIIYEQCDDAMETDGDPSNDSVQFDLTTQDPEVLDGQDPLNYIVSYYATEADANLQVNPLPSLYENIVNPQVIYARVDNDTPDGVTGLDSSICYAIAPLTLQVNPLPELNLEDSYTLCINTNGTEILGPLEIDTGLSTANYSFEWSYNTEVLAAETGSSITPTQGGTYSVSVTDLSTSAETSCTSTDTTEVIESEPPVLDVNLVTQAFADNHEIEAIATSVGDSDTEYEYSLDGGPWQDSGIFSNVSSGSHEVIARDKKGCGISSATIYVIGYPLYFTPNGDGNNDRWQIEGLGSSAKIYIFDRYGKLLKQLSPTGDGWDGTYNGNSMPSSDYWFIVEYTEPSSNETKEFKAHFTLKR